MSDFLAIHTLISQAESIAISQIDGGGRIATLRAELLAGEARIREFAAAEEARIAPLRAEIDQLTGPSREADNEFEAIGRKLEAYEVSRDQLQEIVDARIKMMKAMGLVGMTSISSHSVSSTPIPTQANVPAPAANASPALAPIPAPLVASDGDAASQHAAPKVSEAPVSAVIAETPVIAPRVRRLRPGTVVVMAPASVEPEREADVEFGDAEHNPVLVSDPTETTAEQTLAPIPARLPVEQVKIEQNDRIEIEHARIPLQPVTAAPPAPVAAPRPSWMAPSAPVADPVSVAASSADTVVSPGPAAEALASAPRPTWMSAPETAASPSVPVSPAPTSVVSPGAPIIPAFLRSNG